MKKIMFNDLYGLTKAVLDSRKNMSRRIIPNVSDVRKSPFVKSGWEDIHGYELKPKYQIGEVIAIAQPYKDILDYLPEEYRRKSDGWIADFISTSAGLNNKMFVRANLMPKRIETISVHCERLQDISDEDCLKEGVYRLNSANGNGGIAYSFIGASDKKNIGLYDTPREAFSALIDKVSGKGTWDRNPCVWVYEFELVK